MATYVYETIPQKRGEKPRQVAEGPSATRNVEHRSDEKTHHVMEESIGLDLEHVAARAIDPACFVDATAVIVVGRRRAEHREAPEAVLSHEMSSRRIQSASIQGLLECQLVPLTKRRVCRFVRADVVAVAPAHRTVPRVELRVHLDRARDPHIRRQHCIQRAPQPGHFPSIRHANSHRLASRVYPRVRSPRAQRRDWTAAQPRECSFEHALHGALFGLPLPSAESSSVVVQHELHGPLGHRWKATEAVGCVNQSDGPRHDRSEHESD